MKLLQLNVQNFRNIELASLAFDGTDHFLLGANGQGKTNLLEAANFITALRSFRTQDARSLIMHGKTEARIFYKLEHEHEDTVEVCITIRPNGKSIEVNGVKVKRLSEFIGRFPTIALSAEDIHILRGSPGLRRRFIDITLSATDKDYFIALQKYHKTLQQRNSLLKQGNPDPALLNSFEQLMGGPAATIVSKRRDAINELKNHLQEANTTISKTDNTAELIYKPNCEINSGEDFIQILSKNHERDRIMKSTQSGPHRDDLTFQLSNKNARDYASEGQQRSLVLALKIAQLKYHYRQSETAPVILADDILGQLDPERRKCFWKAIDQDLQIISSGTTPLSDTKSWKTVSVENGSMTYSICL